MPSPYRSHRVSSHRFTSETGRADWSQSPRLPLLILLSTILHLIPAPDIHYDQVSDDTQSSPPPLSGEHSHTHTLLGRHASVRVNARSRQGRGGFRPQAPTIRRQAAIPSDESRLDVRVKCRTSAPPTALPDVALRSGPEPLRIGHSDRLELGCHASKIGAAEATHSWTR